MHWKSVARVFPAVYWIQGYSSAGLKADFVAGLTVALVIVPQSMAYAQLAGLPPYYGLYAALLPPVIGVFQLLLGILRLGLLVNFLSHPVVNGFTNAAALVIATSQLPQLLGIRVDSASHHYQTVIRVIQAATHHCHWPTLGFALMALAIMATIKWLSPRFPYVLVAVVVATLLSWAIHFEDNGKVSLSGLERNLSSEDELIEHEANLAKLMASLEFLESDRSARRRELRDVWFIALDAGDGRYLFYPGGSDSLGDGRRIPGWWRIDVKNSLLDENALVMLGG